MQDKKTKEKKVSNKKTGKRGQAYIENLISKLSPTEEGAKYRLQRIISGIGYALLSWVLCGGRIFFGVQPFAIALLCITEKQIFPVYFGILIALISGRVSPPVIFGATVVLILRIAASFVPDLHAKKRDEIKIRSEDLEDFYSDGQKQIEGKRKGTFWGIVFSVKSFLGKMLCISDGEGGVISESKKSRRRRYNEKVSVRALISSIGGFVIGIFSLILGDYAFYDMFGALMLIFLSPIIVLAFGGADSETSILRGWRHTLSWFAVLCIAIYSGGGAKVIGIPITPFMAMAFTLFLTDVRGVVAGVICGIVFGLIYNPLYAPLLCLCVLIYAFVSPLKKSIAYGTIAIGVVLWCYYFGGTRGLVGTLTPMLVALPVAFICERYYSVIFPERADRHDEVSMIFQKRAKETAGVYFAEAVSEKEKNGVMTDKLGALSEAFSSLSETFNSLVDRFRRPDILGIQKITEMTLEKNCHDCRNHDVCWGVGYTQTLELSNKISSCLHTKGGIDMSDLPRDFPARCPRAERIVTDVNLECEQATENIIQSQKIGAFASNFDDISAILRDALEGEGQEYECDLPAGEKIFDLLSGANYKVKGVVVCGSRNKRVIIKGAVANSSSESFSRARLCKIISEAIGTELLGPVFEVSASETVMMFYSKPKISAVCSHGRISADMDKDSLYADILNEDGVCFFREDSGEDGFPCGDCTRVFVNGNSYFYSLISDGMGSGADAALASEVSSMFVEKMLMAGNRADITVRMLNNFLRSENIGLGRECSATLDLFELDLMNGSASFIKSGAAPTYICREKKVYKVNSRTMPVGIIKQADAKLTKFDTKEHDLVIMISDGCCPDSEECPWLVDYLSKVNIPVSDTSPAELEGFTRGVKNKILTLAIENSPADRHKDDISVSVVLISA